MFDTIFFIPLFNLLVFLHNTVAFHDFGLAIVFLTIFIRLLLSPLSVKTIKSQKLLTELQPRIKEVQEKFKSDPPRQMQEVMKIYRENKVNPFSGFLLLLIQLPILIALYRVSITGFAENSLSVLYGFVQEPEFLNPISLGFIDLTKRSIMLSVLAGLGQFWQTKLTLKTGQKEAKPPIGGLASKTDKPNPMAMMNKQMLYFFPLITIIISISFPAGLPLYWLATTGFSIAEQFYAHGRTRAKN